MKSDHLSALNRAEAYAELVIRSGLGSVRGKRVLIWRAPVEAPEFVAMLAERAYLAGARLVEPIWSSDAVTRARFRAAPADTFTEYPTWRTDALVEAAKRRDCVILIPSSNPDLLRDEQPAAVSEAVKTESRLMHPYLEHARANRMPWCVVAVPSAAWAAKLFPGRDSSEALERLWGLIYSFCRADQPDPVAAWQAHVEDITRRKRHLTAKQYRSLTYVGPGTKLTIGLPERHVWHGGRSVTPDGTQFSPNLPTEEVFTLPHRERVEGTVVSTRPLYYSGLSIEEFRMTFKEGRIIEVDAAHGKEQLERIIDTDEGARRLGEVALVSHQTPIARSGLVFYHPLIDENAASHLAMGLAYRFCLENGEALSDEDFVHAGGNNSAIHIDFMIGSDELDVYGVTSDGRSEPILEKGDWAF